MVNRQTAICVLPLQKNSIPSRKTRFSAPDCFRGSEDLGGGLKATFELEKRFDLFDGTLRGVDWDGAANMGLAGNWGRVRFGRVNELSTETIRKFDPFYQYGVGSMLESSQRSARISNTARYDSPKWSGFSFGASYSLGENTKNINNALTGAGADNDGYAINLFYDNGPFMATANWSRIADSNNSHVWNVGLGYKFGPARVSLLYENTKDKGWIHGSQNIEIAGTAVRADQDTWLLGLEWNVGPGQVDASVQYAKWDPSLAGVSDANVWKYALGYTYNLSKRTAAYATVAYTDYGKEWAGAYYADLERSSVTSFQIGMTHKF